PAVRAERHGPDGVRMALQQGALLSRRHVPESHALYPSRGEDAAVRGERDGVDPALVTLERQLIPRRGRAATRGPGKEQEGADQWKRPASRGASFRLPAPFGLQSPGPSLCVAN